MSDGEPEQVGEAQRFAFTAVNATLGKSTDVDACVNLAGRIDDLMTQALEYFRKAGAEIACRAGCSFCCHLRVMVHPHEAIALFRYLGSRMPREQAASVRRRVIENAARITAENATKGPCAFPCAFLVEGRCSAYDARPVACSGYHSLSRERCEKEHEHRGASAEGIPVLQAVEHVATGLDEGMEGALAAVGLSGTRMELHTAVAALLRNPALIQRWRSGRALVKDG
jgi:hypothetical protein